MPSTTTPPPNPYILASENNQTQLLPLLRSQPTLIHSQDSHGYSLIHAAASYNHADLLRRLIRDFGGDVNIQDTDGETPLFHTESVEIAKVLVEELGADVTIQNNEGMTAVEKLESELEDYDDQGSRELVVYLKGGRGGDQRVPPARLGWSVVSRDNGEEEVEGVVDEEIRRRIETLAERGDFTGEEGQREFRCLVEDVVRGHVVGGGEEEERDRVRRRVD